MAKGLISRIQKYSTKDGPGLRSTVFMVGCNLKCAWCANPELISREPQVMYFRERCTGCGRCVEVAGDGSITLTENGCVIDRERCTNLIECSEACYFDAYERIGYEIDEEELIEKLLRDETFYRNSGGGVTFSGGEPGLQSNFVSSAAARLRSHGIHVALDTAGMIPWEKLENILNNVNLVLYDIKAFDAEVHRKGTAVDNRLILENAQKIASLGKEMHVRMVVVPGMNDDTRDIHKRINFVKDLGASVKRLDLLKYHDLAVGKYEKLGMEYTVPEGSISDDFMQEIYNYAADEGLYVSIGG